MESFHHDPLPAVKHQEDHFFGALLLVEVNQKHVRPLIEPLQALDDLLDVFFDPIELHLIIGLAI